MTNICNVIKCCSNTHSPGGAMYRQTNMRLPFVTTSHFTCLGTVVVALMKPSLLGHCRFTGVLMILRRPHYVSERRITVFVVYSLLHYAINILLLLYIKVLIWFSYLSSNCPCGLWELRPSPSWMLILILLSFVVWLFCVYLGYCRLAEDPGAVE